MPPPSSEGFQISTIGPPPSSATNYKVTPGPAEGPEPDLAGHIRNNEYCVTPTRQTRSFARAPIKSLRELSAGRGPKGNIAVTAITENSTVRQAC
jgi:hypothetical protein